MGTIAEVDALAGEMEVLAGGRRRGGEEGERTLIDAVAVSHEFTDHCHRETLEEVHGDVPVFATEVSGVSFLRLRRIHACIHAYVLHTHTHIN